MSAHTAGPWKLRAGFDEGTKEVFKPSRKIKKPFYPAEIAVVVADDAEGRANARLISAAPDLLAALEGVLRVADRQTTEFDAARAAIKKATGESE